MGRYQPGHFGTLPARAFWDDTRQGILGRCPPGHIGTMPAKAFWDDSRQGILERYPPGPFETIPARPFWDDARPGFFGRCPPGPFGNILAMQIIRKKLPKSPAGLLGQSPPGLRRSLVCLYYGTPMPLRASLPARVSTFNSAWEVLSTITCRTPMPLRHHEVRKSFGVQ